MFKRIFILLFVFSIIASMQANAQQLNYQAIARNANGVALTFRDVGIRLSIRDGSPVGSIVYSETRNIRTNQFGLFTVIIGSPGASNVMGSMASINWISGNKYLQVEIDPEGGSNYFQAGTSQLQAVPYALFANAAYPVGPAGGDLVGSNYPNPKVADNTITNIKLVNPRITLNGLVLNLGDAQDFALGNNGVDVNIVSAGSTHTFNFPDASIANRGLITPNAQTIGGNKIFNNNITAARIIRAGGTASQFLKADGSVDNNIYLTENQPILVTVTGDATGVSNSSRTSPALPLTLATVNNTVGTYGNEVIIPRITVNNKGLVTNIVANPIPTATATTSGLISLGDWNSFNAAFNNRIASLTTVGNSGAATLSANVLNIPNYTYTLPAATATILGGVITGTNITNTSGTISVTNNNVINALGSQTANRFFVAPNGSNGLPTFRAMATGDIPDNIVTNIKLANSIITIGGTNIPLGTPTSTLLGLTSITSGAFVGPLTGNASTASALANARTVSSTGDVLYTSNPFNGSANTTGVATLANSGVTAGIYGAANSIPTITVDAKGRITSVSTNVISGGSTLGSPLNSGNIMVGSVANIAAQVPMSGDVTITPAGSTSIGALRVTDAMLFGGITNAKLTNSSLFLGTTNISLGSGSLTLAGLNSVTSVGFTGALTGNATTATTLQTGRTLSLTGDVAYTSPIFNGSTDVTAVATLANTGVIANSYGSATQVPNFTVDAKGRLIFAGNTTITGVSSLGSTLNSSRIIVGNAANQAADVVMSGDVTINNTGVTTIGTDAITTAKILNANVTNAKLANSSLTIGTTPITLGTAETTITGLTSVTSTGFTGALTGNATTATTLQTGRTLSLTGDVAYTSPTFNGSTDVTAAATLANTTVTAGSFGSATQVPTFIVDAKGRLTAAGNTTITGVSSLGSTLNSGRLIVGNAANQAADVAMSGDVTINNTGATTIGTDAITTAKILNGNVTNTKLASSSLTVGTTPITLGTAETTITGLTLTSPTINAPSINYTNATGITAGTNSQNTTPLTNDLNIITTSSAPSAVTLPTAIAGRRITIVNRGSSPINIFPATGAQIDGLTANAAYSSIPPSGYLEFYAISPIQWFSSSIATTATQWNVTGNSGLDASINFLGTTTPVAFQLRVNNQFAGQINPIASGNLNTSFGALTYNTTSGGGTQNSAFGASALGSNAGGTDNTAIGQAALALNILGTSNTAVGQNALSNNNGNHNTAVGQASLRNNGNTTGNTAVGRAALEANSTGADNTSMGHLSLLSHTNGTSNTALGKSSLTNLTSGDNNVALGFEAGAKVGVLGVTDLITINNSVLLGYRARPLDNSTTNEIVIGHNAVGNGNNTVQLGNTSITRVNTSGAITATGRITGTGARFAFIDVSTNTTLNDNHYYVKVTANVTVTLPDATTRSGQRYVIANRTSPSSDIRTNIQTTSSQTISGYGWGAFSFDANFSLVIFSDGINWIIESPFR